MRALADRLIDTWRHWIGALEDWLLHEPRALHGVAVCRIATALPVLGLLASNYSSRDIWVGQASVWAEPARAYSQFPEIALLDGVSSDLMTVFYVITMLGALALVLGWHAKAANVVTLIGFIAIVEQNPIVSDQSDNLIRISLLWLLLMRTSERWSLDARRRGRAGARMAVPNAMRQAWAGEEMLPRWLSAGLHHVGLIGLVTQTVLLFTAGGLDKVSQKVWQQGTALYYTMQQPEFRPFPGLSDALSSSTVLLAIVTYAVLLSQLFFAPLLLSPVTRRIVVVITVAVNLVVGIALALPWSSAAYIGLACLFVSDEAYERFDEWLRDRLAPVGDWLILRGYDVQDAGAAVLDRTYYPVVDRVRDVVRRR